MTDKVLPIIDSERGRQYNHLTGGMEMALQIIIDGYNLIGRRPRFWQNWEAEREKLMKELVLYHQLKGHPVTVVFDGWRSDWPTESQEMRSGITVIFSKRGEKADQVIARLAAEAGEGCTVVTSDREVADSVQAAGAIAITSGEFERRLTAALSSRPGKEDEQEERAVVTEKKGNPWRLSKAERKKRTRLRKL